MSPIYKKLNQKDTKTSIEDPKRKDFLKKGLITGLRSGTGATVTRMIGICVSILLLSSLNYNCQRKVNHEINNKIYDGPYIDKDTNKEYGSIKIYSNADRNKLEITKYEKVTWLRKIYGAEERFLFKSDNRIFFVNIVKIHTSQLGQLTLLEYETDGGLFSFGVTYKQDIQDHRVVLRNAKDILQKYWNNTIYVIKENRK